MDVGKDNKILKVYNMGCVKLDEEFDVLRIIQKLRDEKGGELDIDLDSGSEGDVKDYGTKSGKIELVEAEPPKEEKVDEKDLS